jgi:predicted metalloprotease with PDZ domain
VDGPGESSVTIVVHPAQQEEERRLVLEREPGEQQGFGLRVVGVEAAPAWARVLWLVPGGPAEGAGLRVGDKVGERKGGRHRQVTEWGGVSLSDLAPGDIPALIEQVPAFPALGSIVWG